jgi:hypothetical protein
MKRISFLTIALVVLTVFSVKAQLQIPNPSFENWLDIGVGTERPNDWHTVKDGKGNASLGSQTIWRDGNAHSGDYCCKVKTVKVPIIGIVTNGALVTGAVCAWTFSKTDGCVDYVPNNSYYTAGFDGRPDSVVFWYKFTPQGSDSCKVEAILGKTGRIRTPDSNNISTPYIVGKALWFSENTTVSNWTRIAVPFTYLSTDNPEYILISVTSSSNQLAGTENSTMWVDDFLCIYNGASVDEKNNANNQIEAYSFNNNLVINMLNNFCPGAELFLYSSAGQLSGYYKLNNSVNKIQLNTEKGVYFYNIIAGGKTYSGKVYINQ